jgi:molecular chaperone IbpA
MFPIESVCPGLEKISRGHHISAAVAEWGRRLSRPTGGSKQTYRIASMEDTVMTTFDFSPLFRTSVGYDRLASLLNSATRLEQGTGFPPYNIQRAGEDHYRITMAVAGFSENELNITTENNRLVVTGEKPEEQEGDENAFLYRGIATRSFERRFNLAEHVRVTGARLDNGLLHIELEREIPEAMKPRSIEIRASGKLLEGESQDKAA